MLLEILKESSCKNILPSTLQWIFKRNSYSSMCNESSTLIYKRRFWEYLKSYCFIYSLFYFYKMFTYTIVTRLTNNLTDQQLREQAGLQKNCSLNCWSMQCFDSLISMAHDDCLQITICYSYQTIKTPHWSTAERASRFSKEQHNGLYIHFSFWKVQMCTSRSLHYPFNH